MWASVRFAGVQNVFLKNEGRAATAYLLSRQGAQRMLGGFSLSEVCLHSCACAPAFVPGDAARWFLRACYRTPPRFPRFIDLLVHAAYLLTCGLIWFRRACAAVHHGG